MEIIEGFNNKKYIVKEKLILKIFTIGYEPMGESIVILVIADGVVKFSAVIDCFEKEDTNLTINILEDYNVNKLDLICLTHPDKDHCKGLEKVLNKTNNTTKILYPVNLLNDFNYDEEVKIVVAKLSNFIQQRRDNRNKPVLKSCINSYSVPINLNFENVTNGYIYPLVMNTYSPVSEVIDKANARNFLNNTYNYQNSHNNLSIMLSLALGDFKMLFCSDIENKSIDIVKRDLSMKDKEFFSNTIDFLKIPHHGSVGSKNILNLLKTVFVSNSVTTIYNVGNISLPHREILNMYKSKSERVYCTSNINKSENIYNYGIVEITVDIFERTVKIEDKKYDEIEIGDSIPI